VQAKIAGMTKKRSTIRDCSGPGQTWRAGRTPRATSRRRCTCSCMTVLLPTTRRTRGLVDHNPHLRRVISQQTEPDVLDGSRPDVRPRQDLASGLQPGWRRGCTPRSGTALAPGRCGSLDL